MSEEFSVAEPGKGRSKKYPFKKREKYMKILRRKPLPKPRKPFPKNVFNTVRHINSMPDPLNEWKHNYNGNPVVRSRAIHWINNNRVTGRLSARQIVLLVAFIFAAWGIESAESQSIEDLVIAEMRQEGAMPLVTLDRGKQSPKRKQSLKRLSTKLAEQREKRLPMKSFFEVDKWLQEMFGTLSTDQQRIDRATAECRDLLSQVYDLVDAPLDGANDGDIKRTYMKPILTPVIHDLALHALRADFRFVNATLNDRTEKVQLSRARKIVRELSEVADISYANADVKQLVKQIQQNPIGWYNNDGASLIGKNIELFIRDITKKYVRRSTDFHKAAIIDASVSGKAIGRRVQNLGETGQLSATLHGTNTQALVIVQHYQQFLNEQLLKTTNEHHQNKINALLAQSLQSGRTDKIVRDVTLLFSIYDSAAQNAFYDAESRKYSTMSEIFVSFIQKDLRELDAKNRGKEEGMNFLNDLLHGWYREFILGTVAILWGIGRCRHGRRGDSASEPAKGSAKVIKEIVRNEECYHIGHNNMLWIREGGEYRRVSNHGRKDSHYVRGRQTKKVSRTKNAREAGTIDSNGNYT